MSFISFETEIKNRVEAVVQDARLHGLWLNTLSYFENCGARKIASCEHPTLVKEEMLKHAAEEFRHAFYLKKQLARIGASHGDYRREHLLGGWAAVHYLSALEVQVCRFLREQGVEELGYLLVTYAIELRAQELYPLYQAALKRIRSKVQVQSILLEEKEHLAEMEAQLQAVPRAAASIQTVCQIEAALFQKWINAVCETE